MAENHDISNLIGKYDHRTITAEELDYLYNTLNLKHVELAQVLQCGRATAAETCKRLRVSKAGWGKNKVSLSREELEDLFITQNKTGREIATILGFENPGPVYRALKKYGIKKPLKRKF